MFTPQIQAALFRAAGQAVISGLAVLGTSLAASQDLPTLGRNFAVAVIAAFVWRAGVEGIYDSNRQAEGKVEAGDVKG